MEENQKALDCGIIQGISNTKEKVSFSRLECIYAYLMFAIGFCFMRFVLWNVTGIFTTIFFIGTAFVCLYYLKKNNYKFYNIHKIIFGLIMIFSLVFSITANSFIKSLDIVFLLMLGSYWVYAVCKENKDIERFFFFDMLKAVMVMPFLSFGKTLQVIVSSTSRSKAGNTIKLVLLGLVVTIPLTMVVALLLISADSGVEAVLNAVFGNVFQYSFITIVQFTMGIPVALYLFGMLYSNVNKVKANVLTEEQTAHKLESIKIFPNLVMYSAVTPVCILYILFFILQIRYFISAFTGILPEAYSYAEYARRGFFELCFTAVINLMILIFINFLSKQSGENKPVLLKVYNVLISVFTILLLTTALSKMILYISNYGLTQLRVYTSWFMLLLAIVNVLIIMKQFRANFNFAKYAVLVFVFLFGVLCFSNVDGNIARYNIKMYQAGYLKELDVDALCNLSDDALVYVLKEKIDINDRLDWLIDFYHNNPGYTYNLSSFRVKLLLEKNQE
ncbi:DUF4153 domain-containing protein [Anaerocolumna sp. MB42-C2]|uniref:DUF4153 domain-containing protein n=1 Tax=Anaerocolumna sp. MB42-C2 TaxID=3070997 RepID=UPI0027DF8CE5|nr:DUF4173 domain-containing protein [Anaerocolumna sp. MB42-C2]WMJ90639.1 DUF4173 domain-containing protein [Anaerocolumna sp. MB42-C2]